MINKFHFYHGVVLSIIVHKGGESINSLKLYPSKSNSSYVLNNKIGLYIKYSESRMSPWRFSIMKEHQDEILEMYNKFGTVFFVLTCKDDGIVCLKYNELKEILDENHENIEWISASRKKNEKYTVCGSNGKLKFKIGNSDFPKKILDRL